MNFKAIIQDATDNPNAAEILAVVYGVVNVVAATIGIWRYIAQNWDKGFDLNAFGIGLAAVAAAISSIIVAIGVAQRARGDRDIELKKLGG